MRLLTLVLCLTLAGCCGGHFDADMRCGGHHGGNSVVPSEPEPSPTPCHHHEEK